MATDDKGRFAIIGLARGEWSFTAEAPGFQAQFAELNIQRTGTPHPPLTFTLHKAVVRPPAGIEGVAAKDLQQQLAAADALFTQQKFDERSASTGRSCRSAPSLSVVNLQIAAAYRNKKDYDKAIAAYNDLLSRSGQRRARSSGIAHDEHREGRPAGGRTDARRKPPQRRSRPARCSTTSAEIKCAKNQTDEAVRLYQKAADADSVVGQAALQARARSR